MRKTCPRAKLTVQDVNHGNAVLWMLSRSAPSMAAGFWTRFARGLEFEQLGVTWAPEMAQPLKRGNLRIATATRSGSGSPSTTGKLPGHRGRNWANAQPRLDAGQTGRMGE
jgi:hypothetical protein